MFQTALIIVKIERMKKKAFLIQKTSLDNKYDLF